MNCFNNMVLLVLNAKKRSYYKATNRIKITASIQKNLSPPSLEVVRIMVDCVGWCIFVAVHYAYWSINETKLVKIALITFSG